MVIIPNFYLKGCRETLPFGSPRRQSFSAKLFHKKVLVGIKQHIYAVFIGLSHDIPEGLDVSVVVLVGLWFHAFPCAMKSDDVHAPMAQIIQVVVGEGVI